MSTYHFQLSIPQILDQTLAAPLLLLRKIWYGYSFRRIRLVNINRYTIVDPADYLWLSKYIWYGRLNHGTYKALRFDQRGNSDYQVFMHREIMFKAEYRSRYKSNIKNKKVKIQSKNQKLNQSTNRQILSNLTNVNAPSTEMLHLVRPRSPRIVQHDKSNAKAEILVVDHINRNGLDNRRANLRFATAQQNTLNRRYKNSSSKYKGLYYKPQTKKWLAQIVFNKKKYYLGYFENEIDAARAYDAAAMKYHGEFALLNFPPEKKEKGLKNALGRTLCNLRKFTFRNIVTQ